MATLLFLFNFKAVNLDFFQIIDKRQFEAIHPSSAEIGSYQCQLARNLFGGHLYEVILDFDFVPLDANLMLFPSSRAMRVLPALPVTNQAEPIVRGDGA